MRPLRGEDPARLGPYRIRGRLGEDGMFLGISPGGAEVVVRLVPEPLDDVARERLGRDVRAARRVARFCTARVLDEDLAGERPYIVSEYVPGPSLSRKVREDGPLEGTELARLAVRTARALAAIHRAGTAHRDLRPGNVVLGPNGPCAVDLGLSGPAGPESDILAWGGTVLFAATGRDLAGLADLDGVDALDAGPLKELVRRALDPDPDRRPTAADLLLRLTGEVPDIPEAGDAPGGAEPEAPSQPTMPTWAVPPPRKRGGRPWPAIATVAAVLMALAALAGGLWLR